MTLPEVFETFIQQRALPVMVRGILEWAFDNQRLDQIFEALAEKQYTKTLLFSTCVELMVRVVTRVQPSLNAAIQSQEGALPVGRDCVFDKINKLENDVVTSVLAVMADDLAEVIDTMQGAAPPTFPGLRTLLLDGNHLQAVQRRLKVLRTQFKAALPGTCVALLDADRKLILRTFLLQDGHASEMSVLPEVAQQVRCNDVLMADRNLCTRAFAATLHDQGAYFLVRQHGTRFPLKLLGERVLVGSSEAGLVYEQQAQYLHQGVWRNVRRVTVELKKPTRNQDQVLHLLTNLPTERIDPATGAVVPIDGLKIAAAYRLRWGIETAFQTMTVDLHCDLNTLGYPPAALFCFCVAAMCYNVYQTGISALRGCHGTPAVSQCSTYYMAHDIQSVWEGMQIAIPQETWTSSFGGLSITALSSELLTLARHVRLTRYRKARTRPRGPPKTHLRRTTSHTSVYKELHPPKP